MFWKYFPEYALPTNSQKMLQNYLPELRLQKQVLFKVFEGTSQMTPLEKAPHAFLSGVLAPKLQVLRLSQGRIACLKILYAWCTMK